MPRRPVALRTRTGCRPMTARLPSLLLGALLAGCGNPVLQAINVQPKLSIEPSTVGGGREVHVLLLDRRVASRYHPLLPVEGGLENSIAGPIAQSLRARGFVVVPTRPADGRELTVAVAELRETFHSEVLGSRTGAVCILQALCSTAEGGLVWEKYGFGAWNPTSTFAHEESQPAYSLAVAGAIETMLQSKAITGCLSAPVR